MRGASSLVKIKKYSAEKSYSDGGAYFSILLLELPRSNYTEQEQKYEISEISKGQMLTMKAVNVLRKWSKFADGRLKLNLKFDFLYEDVLVTSEGFYIIDGNRVIYVSAKYKAGASENITSEAGGFLDTFFLYE